jgi:type VI secretion system protein ImpH
MSAAQWPQPVAVIQRLLEAPHGFEFFQAVRLLEQWWAREEGLSRAQVLATRLSFRNSLSMSFPASEIESLRAIWRDLRQAASGEIEALEPSPSAPTALQGPEPKRQLSHVELTPAFMSLLGATGALPSYYSELLAQRETYHRDGAARAFLDIFLHRAVALFYEAWRKHRLHVRYEADAKEQFLPLMLSVAGIGHKGLRNRLRAAHGGVSDSVLAYFAGPLQRRPVSARTLQQVLSHYFRVPVQLDQFVGRWFSLPEANQSTLGLGNMQLGRDVVIGKRVWQRDLRLRLMLGPLDAQGLRRFLPGGPGALALRELLALLGGPSFEYEVRLAVKAEQLRGMALTGEAAPRLGWDSFLVTHASAGIRTDAGYDLLALA